MSGLNKYNAVFTQVLKVSESELPGLAVKMTRLWDSIGHMTLVAALEDAFDISIEPEDILSFGSYEKGIEILKKYGVDLTDNV